ncbi:MAG TPA: MgtC/SapB family protein [Firmicutes bacterium]|nr:MgtC/SapB family protein [Bacillota bacterium]
MTITYGEIVLRLFTAVVLGGLVGLERESHGRPAGFRTHILVCLGSSLIMILSIYGFASLSAADGGFRTYDPGRLAAQIVSGIGFLGAGTILKEGATIRGLTTAASLWVIAAIGMAVGAGAYFAALATTFFITLTLWAFSKLEHSFAPSKRQVVLAMDIMDQPGQLGAIGSLLGSRGINIRGVDITPSSISDKHTHLEVVIDLPAKANRLDITEEIMKLPGIVSGSIHVE